MNTIQIEIQIQMEVTGGTVVPFEDLRYMTEDEFVTRYHAEPWIEYGRQLWRDPDFRSATIAAFDAQSSHRDYVAILERSTNAFEMNEGGGQSVSLDFVLTNPREHRGVAGYNVTDLVQSMMRNERGVVREGFVPLTYNRAGNFVVLVDGYHRVMAYLTLFGGMFQSAAEVFLRL